MPRNSRSTTDLQVPLLEALARFVERHLGLRCPISDHAFLDRIVGEIARECGFHGAAKCVDWLLREPPARDQLDALASHVANGETYFFREMNGLKGYDLGSFGVPGSRRLRVWSAGCSTGEEPYSLAIQLELAIPDLDQWDLQLLATDVNPRALERARQGSYRGWSLRSMSPALRDRYFLRLPDGRFDLDPRIRRRVTFSYFNLAGESGLGAEQDGFDLILCRNALMHMTAVSARRAAAHLTAALRDGGSLITGVAESHAGKFAGLDEVRLGDRLLYRKPWPSKSTPPPRAGALKPRVAFSLPPSVGASANARLLARTHADAGALDEALVWSARAIADDSGNAEVHYLHASILLELGRHAEASEAFRRVVDLAPGSALGHYMLGVMAQRDGDHSRAHRHLDHALLALTGRHPRQPFAESPGLDTTGLAEMVHAVRGSILGGEPRGVT